ncbi:DUF6461 domain-containing protein [Streptosporangium sp. CA-115845]|uniref:DUF6461 domain-containing protein n=1 Tax=Streptosporangium sp. CA-115845 TaxID=3240071 RepID=UPI003D89EFFC
MRPETYLYDLLVSTVFTEGLDAEMDLWALGFSALWIHGTDITTLASDFSLDPGTRAPCYLSEILDHNISDGSRWVAEVGGWICVVPGPSDDDQFMKSFTVDGRQALSLSMYITGNDWFKYARDGRMVVAFNPTWPDRAFGDDPRALDRMMEGLRFEVSGPEVHENHVEPPESISSALALIGRVTETNMAADWFEALHSRLSPISP